MSGGRYTVKAASEGAVLCGCGEGRGGIGGSTV